MCIRDSRDARAHERAHRGVGVHRARPSAELAARVPAHLRGVRGSGFHLPEQTLKVVHVAQAPHRLHQHVREVHGRRVAQKRVALGHPPR